MRGSLTGSPQGPVCRLCFVTRLKCVQSVRARVRVFGRQVWVAVILAYNMMDFTRFLLFTVGSGTVTKGHYENKR